MISLLDAGVLPMVFIWSTDLNTSYVDDAGIKSFLYVGMMDLAAANGKKNPPVEFEVCDTAKYKKLGFDTDVDQKASWSLCPKDLSNHYIGGKVNMEAPFSQSSIVVETCTSAA